MITERNIAEHLSQFLAPQSVAAMREDMPRWIRRLQRHGVATVPLAVGSESARYVYLFALQAP